MSKAVQIGEVTEMTMPVFEDETLHGVMEKAVRGKWSKTKIGKPKVGKPQFGKPQFGKPGAGNNPKNIRERRGRETFGNRSFGSRIGGTGRSGFTSVMSAVNAAASEMGRLARATYPDRVAAIRRGSRHRTFMIPELGAAVERVSFGLSSGYRILDLTAGSRDERGQGKFDVDVGRNTVAVVHAHWMDNNPSTDDHSLKTRVRAIVRQSNQRAGTTPPGVRFFIFSFTGGLTEYR